MINPKILIASYVTPFFKEFPDMVIEHRLGTDTHYLLLPSDEGEHLENLIEEVVDRFNYQEEGAILCVFAPSETERTLLNHVPLVGQYNKNTPFPAPMSSTLSDSKPEPRSSKNNWSSLGLMLLAALVVWWVIPSNEGVEDVVEDVGGEQTQQQILEENPFQEESQNPTVNSQETERNEDSLIFAKRIKALEEDLADKAATLQEKDKIISDYALAEEKAKQDKTYANLPSTIVRAADIKEGMLLKSPTQQIQLNNITINQTQIQFTYTQNGTTQNGRLQLDAELVRLEGLGAGLCYKTEEEKVVFYLLPERGSVMRFVEE